MPTITVSGLSDAQKTALALADNRLAEDASWSPDLLGKALAHIIEYDTAMRASLRPEPLRMALRGIG